MYIDRKFIIGGAALIALLGLVIILRSVGGVGGVAVSGEVSIVAIPPLGGTAPTSCKEMGKQFELTVSDGTGNRLKILELGDVTKAIDEGKEGTPPGCTFDFSGSFDSDSDVFDVTAGPTSSSLYSGVKTSSQTVSRDKLSDVSINYLIY